MCKFRRRFKREDNAIPIESLNTRNFYERLEDAVDLEEEYRKIMRLITKYGEYQYSLYGVIVKNYLEWSHRGTSISFTEMLRTIGFDVSIDQYNRITFDEKRHDLNDYLAFCQMIIDMVNFLSIKNELRCDTSDYAGAIIDNIRAVLNRIGYGYRVDHQTGYVAIYKNDPAVSIILESCTDDVGEAFLEYNQFLLRGDIEKKRRLLERIALYFEPQRDKLKIKGFEYVEKYLFLAFNNLNIRHNNTDPQDRSKYRPKVAMMSKKDIEKWYDKVYEKAVFAYSLLNNQNRENELKELEDSIVEKK